MRARSETASRRVISWWCPRWRASVIVVVALVLAASPPRRLVAQAADTISLSFVAADLRAVVQGIGRHLDKPLLSVGVPATPVTFETPRGVARASLPALFRGLVEQHGLELTEDSVAWRLRPKPVDQVTALGRAPGGAGQGELQLFVIRLRHARAPDIAASVNQLFGGGGEFSGRQGIGRTGLSDQLRPAPSPTPPPTPSAGASAPRGATLVGQVTIVPDEVTNSLLIRASAADFDVVKGAVDQLDIRPLQVLIEVQIVEARTDRSFSLGNGMTLPAQPVAGGTVAAESQGGGLGDLVVRMMNIGGGDVNAVIRTAQSRGDIEILSRPVIIASNNTEATFLVGSQRPFISVSRSLPTDDPQRDQVVDYKNVGTRLTVLPTINHDGYVTLEILQEINQATEEVQFDAPIISTREAHTQVLVKDGQTIVLGGLRDRQRDRSQRGIPVLSQLPLIGGLFGAASRRTTDTELFLFLTPRILRTDEDVDAATRARLSTRVEGLP